MAIPTPPSAHAELNLPTLTASVCDLVRKVGDFIRLEALAFGKHLVEEKSFNSLVSYVDKEAERLLVEGLQVLLPQAGLIAEEGTGERKEESYNWIIDPLDGTTNFIHGIPIYSISIALAKVTAAQSDNAPQLLKQELLLGVVLEIGRNECFYAYQNGGAWLDGSPLRVSDDKILAKALVATGFPYENFVKIEAYMNLLAHFMKNCHGLRRLGSAAVDLAYVAAGRFEGFFEYNLNPWDVAAGSLLVKEAGGIVTDFEGGQDFVFGRAILAANAHLHAQMQRLIADSFLPL
ncbi:inositol monophosphatase family protein [Hugenholtzia roseola]|uniref:inositol monophosphatase family protein n=1 Tax=Hugenholtzia roseola TaxID=1002 RepID=UPI000687F773|nr:inositol monophosphatase family protein [Hugenholtzia roseola]